VSAPPAAGPAGSGALLGGITATELRRRLLAGELSCRELAEALLIAIGEDPLHAWAQVDSGALAAQAAALDALGDERKQRLALFGVPVGIKDNFDTADLPTAYGSPIYAGHRPQADAAAVSALRTSGALIAGKTKCAELAWMTPPDTLNPLDSDRTPGGSSNGSAAAIAARTVPLATGTQTAGSINRPASYCGVLGLKPTFGRYDRAGTKLMSPTLDTVGLFAHDIHDLRLAAWALDLSAAPPPFAAPLPRAPRVAFAPSELWSQVEPEAADAIVAWREAHPQIPQQDLPGYAALADAQETIQRYESAQSLAPELKDHAAELSPPLREALSGPPSRGAYEEALRTTATRGPGLLDALHGYDAVLTPSAPGVPPLGLAFTGAPTFCRVWTLLGAPSVSVPLVRGESSLPVGLQLVAAPGADNELLAVAETLVRQSDQM
jgi:Asp-tRNA(Asn)/Glu-tRNA(Gln) amidotransferase A subunit family amidase